MKRRLTNNRYYRVKTIQDRHREITRLLLIGLKDVDIAASMNISTQTVRNTKNNPIIEAQLEIMSGARDYEAVDVAKRIQKIAPDAIEFLETVLTGVVPRPKIDEDTQERVTIKQRVDVAIHGLGMSGFSVIKKSIDFSGKLSKEDVDTLKNRALGVKKSNLNLTNIEEADVTDISSPEEVKSVPRQASTGGV